LNLVRAVVDAVAFLDRQGRLPRILTFTARAPLPKSNADVTVEAESGTDFALIVNSPLSDPRETENVDVP